MSLSSQVLPIRFGVFEISPRTSEVRKHGLKVKLGQQAFKLLLLLLERPGETRTREELRQQLWPSNTFVDFEHCLNKAVHLLRQALGDSASNPRYIETIAGQRYREKDRDPRRVGQNLLVRAVAAGEMIRRNDELLLHVELIDVGSGTQLWGAQFKEPYSDVLAQLEKLADAICHQLRLVLAPNMSTRRRERPERAA